MTIVREVISEETLLRITSNFFIRKKYLSFANRFLSKPTASYLKSIIKEEFLNKEITSLMNPSKAAVASSLILTLLWLTACMNFSYKS